MYSIRRMRGLVMNKETEKALELSIKVLRQIIEDVENDDIMFTHKVHKRWAEETFPMVHDAFDKLESIN